MRYEPNPKHKPMPAPGRRGSICPSGVNAGQLLQGSVLHGNKRYAPDGDQALWTVPRLGGGLLARLSH